MHRIFHSSSSLREKLSAPFQTRFPFSVRFHEKLELLSARNFIYVYKRSGGDQEHSPLVRKKEDLGVGISGLAIAPWREPRRADQRDDQP